MHDTNHVLRPIDPDEADALRAHGGPTYVADQRPGYPCRQCLRDADLGDELVLVSHDPFEAGSPYRSASPIFLHRTSCEPYDPADHPETPAQLTVRQLSVRSFDPDEMMIDAAVIDGRDLDRTIRRFFDDDAAHRIHVHNASRGCWAVAVERRPSAR